MLDAELFTSPEMRAALASRDISQVYRLLNQAGVPQRTIAEMTGQSQSEVSEILKGRRVQAYAVLERVCAGLGVERGWMGLAYDEDLEATGEPEVGELTEEMKRRALLAVGTTALMGSPLLGQVLHIPTRPDAPTPLPTRISSADVAALRDLTVQLEGLAQAYGGFAETLTPVAQRAERLLPIPDSEVIKRDLIVAVGELHTIAGWAAFDAHHDDTARYHFARAMSLGGEADDGFTFAKAAYLAGVATTERGHFNDGLKLLQLAQIRMATAPRDKRLQELVSWVVVDSAAALARMGEKEAASAALSAARGGWQAPDADDAADMDWVSGLVEMHLGRPDVALQLVTSAIRHWDGTADRRQAVLGDITLATIYVQAGEPRGRELSHRAIESVAKLHSVRARERLGDLAEVLEARPGSGHRELARQARRVSSQV